MVDVERIDMNVPIVITIDEECGKPMPDYRYVYHVYWHLEHDYICSLVFPQMSPLAIWLKFSEIRGWDYSRDRNIYSFEIL